MNFGSYSKKKIPVPLKTESNRSSSLIKQKEFPKEILIIESNNSKTPKCVASRLVQKRKSIDRKIENLRKLKLEAEMKEVRSKPRISIRSRNLALKADKKQSEKSTPVRKQNKSIDLLNELKQERVDTKLINYIKKNKSNRLIIPSITNSETEKNTIRNQLTRYKESAFLNKELEGVQKNILSKSNSSVQKKILIIDDIDEIEEDIKILEKVLNIDVNQKKTENINLYKHRNSESDSKELRNPKKSLKIIEKIKKQNKSGLSDITAVSEKLLYTDSKIPQPSSKPKLKSPSRKFIKKKSSIKQKSTSMEILNQFKFNYRSLSPYQIQIIRHNEK
jgi:hypothetical protein